mmetsp:Transcript_19642/g.30294  ORF Transcript_19642/g.30294 Transcript_19642/m.30294 type:complete len:327 (-) Transcript_19642:404-1384(-)
MMIVLTEFTQVTASHGLNAVIRAGEALISDDGNEVEVLLSVEQDVVLLPELLLMARTPSQLSSSDLVLELLDGTEDLLVGLEVLGEALQHLVDVFVNPVAVLQLEDQVENINVGEVLLASRDVLQVVNEHKHDASNLLPAEEVHDLGHLLDDCKSVILEELLSVVMIAQNPEGAHHVVADLRALEAGAFKEVGDHTEAVLGRELSSELVRLKDSHQSESVGVDRKRQRVNIVLLSEVVQELASFLVALVEVGVGDQDGEHVGGDVSLDGVLNVVLVDEAVQDGDHVLGVLELIHDGNVMLNASSVILKDAVEVSEGVGNQVVVALH